MTVRVIHGDCLEAMRALAAEGLTVHSVVTDPPYGLEFMGREWDRGVPGVAFWQAAADLLPPGGHLLALGGTRTYHRLACAIEDAGFEIRDQIGWLYGSGFPKSRDVSKALDKMAGAEREVVRRATNGVATAGYEAKGRGAIKPAGQCATCYDLTTPATDAARQWQGWGTTLKPAWEPIVVARKPLAGTVAENVLKHGTGALNIAATRVPICQGSVHSNPGDSRGDTSLSRGASRSGHSENSDTQASSAAQHGSDSYLLPNACGCGFVDPRFLGSQVDCQTCSRCGGELARDPEGRGQASSRQQPDARISRDLHGGRGYTREDLSRTCGDYTAQHVETQGRWPANVVHDGSDEVLAAFAAFGPVGGGSGRSTHGRRQTQNGWATSVHGVLAGQATVAYREHKGSSARFFYAAKASKAERAGSKHPTVKPLALMRWLVRLVTPPGGTVLDPFAGSGTTGEACDLEGFSAILIEREAEYVTDIRARLERARSATPLLMAAE